MYVIMEFQNSYLLISHGNFLFVHNQYLYHKVAQNLGMFQKCFGSHKVIIAKLTQDKSQLKLS